MTTAHLEKPAVSEAEAVIQWRFDALARAGYALVEAAELSVHLEVDLHRATDLLRCGCPAETAVRILL